MACTAAGMRAPCAGAAIALCDNTDTSRALHQRAAAASPAPPSPNDRWLRAAESRLQDVAVSVALCREHSFLIDSFER